MNSIISESKGSSAVISERLGIPAEQLESGDLVRIEFLPGEKYNPKIPSGNEWGARDTDPIWLPGGKLPNGDWEAVVSTKGMEKGIHYEVYDFKTGEIYD